MRLIIFIVFLFSINILSAQINTSKNWYFGNKGGLRFNDTNIIVLNNGELNTWEGCSSISDKNGNLVLYSDGITVWNKYHKIIKNGTGLLGDKSSTQSVLIINHSDNDSIYYILTTPYAYDYNVGMRYSVVNVYANNDSSEIVEKNIVLHNNSAEKLNAVKHQNGRDIWIAGHEYGNNNFYTYLLTKNGFSKCPIMSSVGFNFVNSQFLNQGNIKFSSNGKYLVNTFLYDNNSGYIEIFKFNSQIGKLEFNYQLDNVLVYGCEYSPNFNYLYLTDQNNLIQINLKDYTKIVIKSHQNYNILNSIQIANNKKIYISLNDSNYLSVINHPDSPGLKCDFKLKGISLGNGKSKFGLPNFNQSYFYTPSIDYNYETNCIKNSIQFWGKDTFGANNHTWHIKKLAGGNWQLAGSTKDINYTFADTGTYEVRYIASNGNKADTVVKSIVLYDKIKKDFLGKDTTYVQGDVINKTLFAPTPNHCVRWYFDKLSTGSFKEKGSSSSLLADSVGTYICKVTNQAFCEVWDTIVISECINNLNQPSLFRSRDTLRTFHLNADSFVWYRNNQIYKITKQAFLALTDTGTYRVEAAKKGHCNSSSIGTNYVQRLNVNRINIEDLGIRVFPNPSNGNINIQSQTLFKLEINTVLGQTIYQGENINNIHLPKGIYFLHFEIGGYRSVEKVVVW